MPIFRYRCKRCNMEFELLLPKFDSPAACPLCHSKELEQALNRVGVLSHSAPKSCAVRNECPAAGKCGCGKCGCGH